MADRENIRKGLKPATDVIFDEVSKLDCLKDLWLCGGTAQSIQMQHRQSEDLDFEVLGLTKNRPTVEIDRIFGEIKSKFPQARREIVSSEHYHVYVDDVKLSFFRPQNSVPKLTKGLEWNNIKTPTLQELLGMKLFTITVRSTFRDYYDIACLLDRGLDLKEGILYAGAFSRHTIHTRDILAALRDTNLYRKPDDFDKKYKSVHPEFDTDSMKTFFEKHIEKMQKESRIESLGKIYDSVSNFSEGFCIVSKNGKFNYADLNGTLLAHNWLDYASPFNLGKAVCVLKGNSVEINSSGIITEILSRNENMAKGMKR